MPAVTTPPYPAKASLCTLEACRPLPADIAAPVIALRIARRA